MRTIVLRAMQLVLVVAVTFGLFEGLVAWSFAYPSVSPIPQPLLRHLHVRFDRNSIQAMPECAVFDPYVTYTLRPGRCTFANREYSTEYRINSLGVRDDEASLAAPPVVILGDSVTMGWGVGQDEAFPSVFERLTGVRTLNAGIASYGTVRELRLLERVDRGALRDLVIQYSGNDRAENEQYVRSGGTLKTLSAAAYARAVEDNRRDLTYVPGKYAVTLLGQFRGPAAGRGTAAADDGRAREATAFVRVLETSPVDLAPYRVTVLSLQPAFIQAARKAASGSSVSWVRRLTFLDASPAVSFDGAFYVLDDHPRARAHEAIGRALARQLAPEAAAARPARASGLPAVERSR